MFEKKKFDTKEIKSFIQAEDAYLVDVRTPEEFEEGSPEGAINIPLHEVPSRLDEFKTERPIVVFCRTGNRSGQAETYLKQQGITNVVNGGSFTNVANLLKEAK